MKISVAMTTYNGERFLQKQLESIRKQNRKVDEVIICDDCSVDATTDIVQQYIKEYKLNSWKLIINNNNLGYIKNFNKAISLTSGDYIFLCDQDDEWEPNKTEKMVESILKVKADVMCSSFVPIDKNSDFIPLSDKQKRSNMGLMEDNIPQNGLKKIELDIIVNRNISPGCTVCFSKDIKKAYIRCNNTVMPHDWMIVLLGACKESLWYFNSRLTRYRLHESNTIGIRKGIDNRGSKKQILEFEELVEGQKLRIKIADSSGVKYDKLNATTRLQYYELRKRFLEDVSIKNWWSMLYKSSIYRKHILSPRIVGDILRIFHINEKVKHLICK